MKALWDKHATLRAELAKFGVVGAINFLVQVVVSNALYRNGHGFGPLTSNGVATLVSATSAFVMNRFWSFRDRESVGRLHHEYGLFMVLNLGGLVIAEACLGFSHYVLGLTSTLAFNIAGNGVGLVLGTLFRFWSYRRFVWLHPETAAPVLEAAADGDLAAAAVLDLTEVHPERQAS